MTHTRLTEGMHDGGMVKRQSVRVSNMLRTYLQIALVALVAFGCNRAQVGRDEWLAMTLTEKRVVVESFIGHQKAAEAKGATPWKPAMEVDDYVRTIEAAYRRGDPRTVTEIWKELASKPSTGTADGQP